VLHANIKFSSSQYKSVNQSVVTLPTPYFCRSSVRCSCFSTCLVCTEKGRVYSFGSNKYGGLGLVHPTPTTMTTPTVVEPMKGVVKVACGRHHSAAIDGECRVGVVKTLNIYS